MKLVHGMFYLLLGALVSACTPSENETARLQISEEIIINAPADTVWNIVENFDDLGAWHPAVKSTEILEGSNNQPGAVRLLTLQDDGTITEELIAHDADAMTFEYVILEGVLPVEDYQSVVSVSAESADTSKVTWSSDFSAAAGVSDEDSVNTMIAVYRAGLDNLKSIAE